MINNKSLKKIESDTAVIIKEAGKMILQEFSNVKHLSYKDYRDFSTSTDLKVEKFLKNKLKSIFPLAGFLIEEGESSKKNIYNWAIDPIDQTKNFAAKLPMFFTQIALVENDISILGHIYQPVADQLFSASRGNGAFLNGNKLITDEKRYTYNAIVDLDIAGSSELEFKKNLLKDLIPQVYRIRVSGGSYPVYMTTGAIDGFIGIYKNVKFIDLAPRMIIINESGLNTEYFEYNNLKFFIAGNKNILSSLKEILEENKKYL